MTTDALAGVSHCAVPALDRQRRRRRRLLAWLWAGGHDARLPDLIRETPATFGIALLGVALFGSEVATGTTQTMLEIFGGSTSGVLDRGEWWRVLTVVFTDPASWGPHPLSLANTVALLAIGPRVERQVGSAGFLVTYFTAHLFTAGSVLFFLPTYPDLMAGSSGGVGGIYGALCAIACARAARCRDLRRLPWGVPLSLGIITLFSATTAPAISNIGHAAAVPAGALLGLALSAPRHRRQLATVAALGLIGAAVAAVVYRSVG